MLLGRIRVKNFRNFADFETTLDPLTIIIGPNNVGKSNLLAALQMVLGQTTTRNVRIAKSDFRNPSEAIVIEAMFENLTEEDKAAFFHQDGLVNPRQETLAIRFTSRWDLDEQDVVNECYFVRDDREPQTERVADFTFPYRRCIQPLLNPASRSAEAVLSLSERRDFGKVLRLFAGDYLKPVEALKQHFCEALDSLVSEFSQMEPLPSGEEKEVLDIAGQMLEIIRGTPLQSLAEPSSKPQLDSLKGAAVALGAIGDRLRGMAATGPDVDNSEWSSAIERLEATVSKATTLLTRLELQANLRQLGQGLVEGTSFQTAQDRFQETFKLLLPHDTLNLRLFPVSDDELLSDVSAVFGKFPLEQHGSGYQAIFNIGMGLTRILAEAEIGATQVSSTILMIDEVETHLHPHMQRFLLGNLKRLQEDWADRNRHLQILVTTHSPSSLNQVALNNVLQLRRHPDGTCPVKWSESDLDRMVAELEPDESRRYKRRRSLRRWCERLLQEFAEAFFTYCVIIVEGDTEAGALPVFAMNLAPPVDCDLLGITVINVEGGGDLQFVAKLLEKLGIDYVCFYDRGDDHKVSSISEGQRFPSLGNEFEDDVVVEGDIGCIIRALDNYQPEGWVRDQLGQWRKRDAIFDGINSLEELIGNISSANEDSRKRLRAAVTGWIKSKNTKSIEFGRELARCMGNTIPQQCEKVLREAERRARLAVGL